MSDFVLGPLGESLTRLIQDLSSPVFDLYFGVVTTLGDTLPILIVIVLLYYTYNKDFLSKMVYLLIFSAYLNRATKVFFHNPRPYLYKSEFQVTTNALGKQTLWGASGFSFPSGHSQNQGTFWVYIFSKIRNIPIIIVGSILLISIPLSRTYLGVHWPSDIIVGVLYGICISLVFIKIDSKYRNQISEWSDMKKISVGILASCGLVLIGLVSFYLGTLLPFNDPIAFDNPSVWLELDIATYPGLLAGIVTGQVFEKKLVNFNTDHLSKTKMIIRGLLGIILAIILYLGAKVIDTIAEGIQADILWITQVTDFTSYLIIGFFMAFCIPWLFDKLEN